MEYWLKHSTPCWACKKPLFGGPETLGQFVDNSSHGWMHRECAQTIDKVVLDIRSYAMRLRPSEFFRDVQPWAPDPLNLLTQTNPIIVSIIAHWWSLYLKE